MKLTRVGLLSLACVGGAFVFGMVANAAIDLVIPSAARTAAAPAKPVEAPQPVAYALASTTSTPADIAPIKVKTIPMLFGEERAEPAVSERTAAVPLPRPRPASAPDASIARQPGALAISAATKKSAPEDDEPLSPGQIDRMRTALALTAEQEVFWPAIAVELRAIGKSMRGGAANGYAKVSVDEETKQRLYWAAAPLITRLSYEQKLKAKQMARLMGLTEVAEAL